MAQMADVAARMCVKCENLIILKECSEKTLSSNDVKRIVKENFLL